ncbi:MAG: Glu/Leu/Phe/Val dehydrogenase dimerization domain-containing protein, partial [Planctomycetaceae bacterium]
MNGTAKDPAVLVSYTDPVEGFKGYLAIDCLTHSIAAGGFRVQEGLTAEHIIRMAKTMTLKHRLAGNRVDGAKSGIDYDPTKRGKREAVRRFFEAIRPYIASRYSMGPDLNTTLAEIDSIAAELQIPSVKMAVAQGQKLGLKEFLNRYKVLQEEIDGFTVDRRRSGHGVAVACVAALRNMGVQPRNATAIIQGFGSVGTACAFSLFCAGVKIIAISDVGHSLICDRDDGLDIPGILETRNSDTRIDLRTSPALCHFADRNEVFDIP